MKNDDNFVPFSEFLNILTLFILQTIEKPFTFSELYTATQQHFTHFTWALSKPTNKIQKFMRKLRVPPFNALFAILSTPTHKKRCFILHIHSRVNSLFRRAARRKLAVGKLHEEIRPSVYVYSTRCIVGFLLLESNKWTNKRSFGVGRAARSAPRSEPALTVAIKLYIAVVEIESFANNKIYFCRNVLWVWGGSPAISSTQLWVV